MSDRELLELAAKAAGLPDTSRWTDDDWETYGWNPLTDDGDALRLAVKLKMEIAVDFDRIDVTTPTEICATEYLYELPTPTDPYAATRRAIVCAASEIGRQMK